MNPVVGDQNELGQVNPSPYWPNNPEMWVKQIEYLCEVKDITSPISKFSIAVGRLDKERSLLCRDLIENFYEFENVWDEFKKRICDEDGLQKRHRIRIVLDGLKEVGKSVNNVDWASQAEFLVRDCSKEDILKELLLMNQKSETVSRLDVSQDLKTIALNIDKLN